MDGRGRRIAFVGSQGFADFYGIGGMQSYVRRLSLELAGRGHCVEYLVHGARAHEVSPVPGLRVRYFRSLTEVLAELSSGDYSDIIRVWLERWDRLEFLRYVLSPKGGSRPHHYMWFVMPDSQGKRLLGLLEGFPASRGGRLFCVSARQWRAARRWTRKASLLMPPIPQEFFLRPEDKPLRWPLRVAFLGVLHPDKGIREIVELFTALEDEPRFQCSIHATHDPGSGVQRALHDWLLRQPRIRYVPMERRHWSGDLEREVRTTLAETDVFLQPLQSLQNTVDTPLLVLEAMASLCLVLTTPLGSISELCASGEFVIPHAGFAERAATALKTMSESRLREERTRIHRRNQELAFSQAEVADAFLAAIGDGKTRER
jgi:glycosyltransferase involved in cell wall biosynthesis